MGIKRTVFTGFAVIVTMAALVSMAWGQEKPPARIEARSLHRMLENREPLLLINLSGYLACMDARIPGSVCLSCDGQGGKPDILPANKETRLVFYNGGMPERGCRFIEESQRRGFANVYILRGGLPAWRKAGYDTESVQRIRRTPGRAVKPGGLNAWLQRASNPLILDIRSIENFKAGHLEGAMNIPFSVLHLRYPDIPLGRSLLIVDDDGTKSFLAAGYLSRKGFSGIARLAGGMAGWDADTRKGAQK